MTNSRRLTGRSVNRSRRMPMGPRRAIRLLSAISYALLVALGLITAVEAQEDDARCEGLVGTLVGTADDDCLRGTEGDDVIHGRRFNLRLSERRARVRANSFAEVGAVE